MIHGSEGTEELFQLKVTLSTGKAVADTLPQDGLEHWQDDEEKDIPLEDRISPLERLVLLSQYEKNRQSLPTSLE